MKNTYGCIPSLWQLQSTFDECEHVKKCQILKVPTQWK